MNNQITGRQLREMILAAAAVLEQNKQTLDELNVFPVPDGDTGTNMSLTMVSAAREVAQLQTEDGAEVVKALSLGALKGARGNSGVILSQIFAGFAESIIKSDGNVDAIAVAQAWRSGVQKAYKAVMKPKEGTILTVATSIADAAEKYAQRDSDIQKQLEYVVAEAEKTLKQTPDMLPVLKEAGVVDAGGAGLVAILLGFQAALDGRELDTASLTDGMQPLTEWAATEESNTEILYAYCTEFFIKNISPDVRERDVNTFRRNLMKIGDCVLVVGDLKLIKTHVHTNEPGLALQYAQLLGELSQIKIDNMREQHRELPDVPETDVEKAELAVITVVAGEGIKDVFRDCQINHFVSGGQSMNPSTQDILHAIREANAKNIIILPNNKNIVLAAEQAADLCPENVAVIRSTSFPQGISAAIAYDPDAEMETNVQRMRAAIETVRTGCMTTAVRDTKIEGMGIAKGELLGIAENKIVASGSDEGSVFLGMMDKLVGEDSELITLYYGEDASEQQANVLQELLGKHYPACDVDVHFGGQPVYPYIVSVE